MSHGHNGHGDATPEVGARSLATLESELAAARALATLESELAAARAHVQRLQSLEKVQSDFLSLATHELRSPLAIIKGYLSMLESGVGGEVNPRMGRLLDPIARNVDLMSEVVNELTETARLDDQHVDSIRERVDLRELVTAAAARVARSPGHQLSLDAGGSPATVLGDRSQLLRVFGNLIDNAVKYSPEGGVIAVVVRAGESEVEIDVTDSGIGIAEPDLPHLFTRFGRIVTDETRDISGTGLGLYLCREMVRRHGGEVTASSAPGKGSRFRVRLPAAVAAELPDSARRR